MKEYSDNIVLGFLRPAVNSDLIIIWQKFWHLQSIHFCHGQSILLLFVDIHPSSCHLQLVLPSSRLPTMQRRPGEKEEPSWSLQHWQVSAGCRMLGHCSSSLHWRQMLTVTSQHQRRAPAVCTPGKIQTNNVPTNKTRPEASRVSTNSGFPPLVAWGNARTGRRNCPSSKVS